MYNRNVAHRHRESRQSNKRQRIFEYGKQHANSYSIFDFFGYCRCTLQLYFRRTRARSYDDGSTRCAVRRITEFPPSRHVPVTNQISRLNHTRFFHSEVRLAFAEERDYGTVSVLLFNVLPPWRWICKLGLFRVLGNSWIPYYAFKFLKVGLPCKIYEL